MTDYQFFGIRELAIYVHATIIQSIPEVMTFKDKFMKAFWHFVKPELTANGTHVINYFKINITELV